MAEISKKGPLLCNLRRFETLALGWDLGAISLCAERFPLRQSICRHDSDTAFRERIKGALRSHR
jgi:hypothetical protein